jgi:hypothetical protein
VSAARPVARSIARARAGALALALVVALVVTAASCGGDDDAAAVTSGPAKVWAPSPIAFGFRADHGAADRFVDVGARRQRATYLVEATFVRTVDGQDPLEGTYKEVNRPPDHVSVGFGTVAGRVGDRTITCGELPDGSVSCAPGQPAAPLEQERAAEIEELRALVADDGWYRVDAAPDRTIAGEAATCFGLRQRNELAAPPFGRWARLCYAADGAPLDLYVAKVGSRDVRTATTIRRDVTAEDVADLVGGAGGPDGEADGGG